MTRELMNTREIADYLRIKERKVYDLVAKGRIPCTRVTGKWLFPKPLIDRWLGEHAEGAPALAAGVDAPPIITGSHDPLLDWAARESGSSLAVLFNGSLAGLEHLAAGQAMLCGMHVYDADSGEYNIPFVRARLGGEPVVCIEWARREQGLIVARDNPHGVESVRDLVRVRFQARQKEAGSHLLLEHLLREQSLSFEDLRLADSPALSESDVAMAVAEGAADAGLGIAAVARQHGVGFVSLWQERYDLLVWRRVYFDPPVQRLIAFAHSARFRRRAAELAGYDIAGLGSVHFNGP
ncbi:MAG: helix-turn-helix transcriptional regulator [Gammaproteobacteria bacterium]|nr:helix-turn-helix transcriptional regulator [Gammaproteobacteria bacterium]